MNKIQLLFLHLFIFYLHLTIATMSSTDKGIEKAIANTTIFFKVIFGALPFLFEDLVDLFYVVPFNL